MNYKFYLFSLALSAGSITPLMAQSAIDAMRLTQQDMKGTARFMSMGGAFGALGGDLTTISQNPAGIGVYRSNEIGITFDLDLQSANSESGAGSFRTDQTKFLINNIGGVLTLRLPSKAVPNLNFGFTYNKTASFNRSYGGGLGDMQISMSNWMAGVANSNGLTVGDVPKNDTFDPYNPNDGGSAAPWVTILGYDSYLINPEGNPDNPNWTGQFGQGTSGTASYGVSESGGIDSFNIAIGGNIGNVVFWGMDFDITNLNYNMSSYYQERMENAYVMSDQGLEQTLSDWSLRNWYKVNGTGFAYKLGLIFRPIQEFRVGFAFHTPTYYNISEQFWASTDYSYNEGPYNSQATNDGVPGYNELRYRSPWHMIVSAAGVIGNNLIISADYEWTQTSRTHFKDASYIYDYGWDYSYAPTFNSYEGVNMDIKSYYRNQNTFRVGAEFRVTPKFSIRAGYSNVSSPVREAASDGHLNINTAGTNPDFRFDNSTNYYTAGLGYRTSGFYADLAYVHKQQSASWHAFDSDAASNIQAPKANLNFTSNQLVLSLGYKF